jgi:integrase
MPSVRVGGEAFKHAFVHYIEDNGVSLCGSHSRTSWNLRILVDNRPQLGQPKTKRSSRTVPLDAETLRILHSHKARQAQERLAFGPGYADTDLVFTREDGTPVNPRGLTHLFNLRVRDSGLPRIRLHDLRHTFATLALQSGLHTKVISDLLGHSSTSFTMDVYSHAIPRMEEAAVESFAALVMG